MTDVSSRNFGFLIAYVIPGFVVVITASAYSVSIRSWLGVIAAEAPTVSGFLYVTLSSVAAGMSVSAVRWLILDFIHHRTGVKRPDWDFSALEIHHSAVVTLLEQHYRYYQFYGNMLVAIVISSAAPRALFQLFPGHNYPLVIGILVTAFVYFVASRDSLCKYYARTATLLDGTHSATTVPDRK